MNPAQGVVKVVNQGAESLFGSQVEKLVSQPI
jgi:hypothetical protein